MEGVLLGEHAVVVRGTGHLMHLRVERVLIGIVARVLVRAVAALLNLLQQVVLVLAHHNVTLLLTLLQLVLQRLCIDSHAAFRHNLLARAGSNTSQLKRVDSAVEWQ